MSVRLYVGNLPQTFDAKELEALFSNVGEGVRFKAVNDRETGACRGFGFANVDDLNLAEAVIAQLNGKDFGGNSLRIEISEQRCDSRAGGDRRPGGRSDGSPQERQQGGPCRRRRAKGLPIPAGPVSCRS